MNIALRRFLHNHGNIATEGSPKPGLCPTLISNDFKGSSMILFSALLAKWNSLTCNDKVTLPAFSCLQENSISPKITLETNNVNVKLVADAPYETDVMNVSNNLKNNTTFVEFDPYTYNKTTGEAGWIVMAVEKGDDIIWVG